MNIHTRHMARNFLIAVLAVIVILGVLYGFNFYRKTDMGPLQPIPFSHRVHVHVKKISCFMCHPESMDTARAGIPPLQTCMLCHSRVIITYPWIQKLRDHFFDHKPVIWKKVYSLPNFVYFEHSMHIRRRIDCSHCHGNVPTMDRIVKAKNITMGFCIDCHKKYKATHDCFTCHR